MNKLTKIALAASLLVGGIASTQACSLGAWDSNGSAAAGGPADANVIARYEGLCSMQVTAANGNVTNTGVTATSGPAGEASMIARFYFLPGAATGDIFTTYAEDALTTVVYTVSYDGTNVTVTPNGGGAAAVVAAGATNWHSVEVKWANNGGAVDVWVDTDATTDPADASTTSALAGTLIEAGVLGGSTGMIFDAYESRRTTSVGRLLKGDGNGNGSYSVADAVVILNEALSPTTNTATGTPDTNEDGNVTVGDAILTLNLALGA